MSTLRVDAKALCTPENKMTNAVVGKMGADK
jgi:hypothetical protein